MQDIHGIRPPVMVGMDPALVKALLITGAGILALGLIILLVWYFLKKRRKETIPELVPAIPAYDRALADLDRMASATDPKVFYFELGRTVKAYMGEVFQTNCLEMTTQELVRTVKGLKLPRELKGEIARFQELCDPFRYAPVAPSQDQVRADLARARTLVDRVEKETAPETPEPGGAS